MSNGKSPPDRADHSPPQNLEAERGVLGSILLVNDVFDEIADSLRAEHFYLDAHRRIFQAINDLRESGVHGLDAVTVGEALARRNELNEVGGVEGLLEILRGVPHAAHARYYADIVREKWMLRRLIYACTEILRESYDEAEDPQDLLAKAEQSIFQIVEQQESGQQIELRDILLDTFDRINDRLQNQGSISGLTTGFSDLDQKTNGLQPSELIILAARPSMGKTALVVNMAEAVAVHAHATWSERIRRDELEGRPHPVGQHSTGGALIFSLEQSKVELAERFLCIRARLQVHKLRKGDLNEDERDLLLRVSSELSELPLYIDDQPGRSMSQISAIARRLRRRVHIGLVIIDYLQLIEPEDKRAPREQQIAQITRRLKFLAKELQIPVIALAQLNRGVETRDDKRPRLADLRESGAIEQDADIVMFLHRPEMYEEDDRPGEAELIVAKHRSGPTGIVPLAFSKESMRFHDFSPLAEPEGGYFSGPTSDF